MRFIDLLRLSVFLASGSLHCYSSPSLPDPSEQEAQLKQELKVTTQEVVTLIKSKDFGEAARRSLGGVSTLESKFAQHPGFINLIVPSIIPVFDDWAPISDVSQQSKLIRDSVSNAFRKQVSTEMAEGIIYYKQYKFMFLTSIYASVKERSDQLLEFDYNQIRSLLKEALAVPITVKPFADVELFRIAFAEDFVSKSLLYPIHRDLAVIWGEVERDFPNQKPIGIDQLVKEARKEELQKANTFTNRMEVNEFLIKRQYQKEFPNGLVHKK